jgi:hypothetical protein
MQAGECLCTGESGNIWEVGTGVQWDVGGVQAACGKEEDLTPAVSAGKPSPSPKGEGCLCEAMLIKIEIINR